MARLCAALGCWAKGKKGQQAHAAHKGRLQRGPLQLFCAQALVEGGRVVGCLGKLLAIGHAEDGGVVHRPPAQMMKSG